MGVSWGLEDGELDVGSIIGEVQTDDCGAVTSFSGTVRSSAAAAGNRSRSVVGLEYEAHPVMAEEAFVAIAREVMDKWDVRSIAARHRIGLCELGAPTVVIACSAPHRAEALDAIRYLIDELKKRVPLFKKELYEDGTAWVGAEGG